MEIAKFPNETIKAKNADEINPDFTTGNVTNRKVFAMFAPNDKEASSIETLNL